MQSRPCLLSGLQVSGLQCEAITQREHTPGMLQWQPCWMVHTWPKSTAARNTLSCDLLAPAPTLIWQLAVKLEMPAALTHARHAVCLTGRHEHGWTWEYWIRSKSRMWLQISWLTRQARWAVINQGFVFVFDMELCRSQPVRLKLYPSDHFHSHVNREQ